MTSKIRWSELDTFTRAFIVAFFFTETPEGRMPRGEYSEYHAEPEWDRFPVADQQRIIQECIDFQGAQAGPLQDYPTENAGHDFLYSRNGHGVGFWENDFGTEEQCERLQAAAKAAGPCYLERWKGRNYFR